MIIYRLLVTLMPVTLLLLVILADEEHCDDAEDAHCQGE